MVPQNSSAPQALPQPPQWSMVRVVSTQCIEQQVFVVAHAVSSPVHGSVHSPFAQTRLPMHSPSLMQ
jgi:hypothetical protein